MADDPAYERVLNGLKAGNCETVCAQTGDVISAGGVRILFLAPLFEYDDVNNMSISLKKVYGETSFLFTGDTEAQAELDMVKRYDPEILKSDVLKLGHHGSATSSAPGFINAVKPRIAVASCERSSSYGHPAPEVVKLLKEAGAEIFVTYEHDVGLKLGSDGQKLYILN